MADESRGTDAGVSMTPIYTDGKGRRRRGDVQSQDPNNLDDSSKVERLEQLIQQLQAKVDSLTSQLQTLRSDFDSDFITGPGHSGNGKGKQFNPSMTIQAQCNPDVPGQITGTVTLN